MRYNAWGNLPPLDSFMSNCRFLRLPQGSTLAIYKTHSSGKEIPGGGKLQSPQKGNTRWVAKQHQQKLQLKHLEPGDLCTTANLHSKKKKRKANLYWVKDVCDNRDEHIHGQDKRIENFRNAATIQLTQKLRSLKMCGN